MKKHYLIGFVAVILAVAAAIYAWKTRSLTGGEKSAPAGQTQTAPEHQGHEATGTQEVQEQTAQEPAEESPAVEIPEDKRQMLGVETVEVAVRELRKVIRTVGRIEYDERRLATVNAKFEGWIEKLHVDYTGRQVKKGEPLAEIYSPELVATQQEFINAAKWARRGGDAPHDGTSAMLARDANTLREASRQRLKLWDISEEQIRKIEDSGNPVRTLTLHSPVDGYVVQKMALQGMRVMPGEKLFDIADLSSVWVVADIYENELPLVRPGQTAKISLSYFPGREMTAVIDFVYPVLSSESRTGKVRFTVPNTGLLLKPQMFTNVEIAIPLGKKLAVPAEAVLDTGIRQIVYVDKGDGYFEPREIRTGIRVEQVTEVLAGLRQGERIASSAIFLIDSEAQIKGVKPLAGGHKH
jgi:Cu(I)/Ag(I) efflux system membrane fusion protein